MPLPEAFQSLAGCFRPNRKRAERIEDALQRDSLDTRLLWPQLDTMSCRTDAGARPFVPELHAAIPHAWIQNKGLLATEGEITIPLSRLSYPVLAVSSGFFEFMDDRGRAWLCHELQEAETYRVILTTYGGLYRYDIGDRVHMRGWPALSCAEYRHRGA